MLSKKLKIFSAFLADEGEFYNDGFDTTTTATKSEVTTAAANSPTTVVTKVIYLENKTFKTLCARLLFQL